MDIICLYIMISQISLKEVHFSFDNEILHRDKDKQDAIPWHRVV